MQSNSEMGKSWSILGLEITVQCRFIGAEKAVEWAEKNIKTVFENINKKVYKCVE